MELIGKESGEKLLVVNGQANRPTTRKQTSQRSLQLLDKGMRYLTRGVKFFSVKIKTAVLKITV
jgi:hypothetical protein